MRMKSYAVTLYYSGSETFFVDAPDESEAEGVAMTSLLICTNWTGWK